MKVISLGWGVQSWTLAAMVALGELEPVDVALHSDTTWERAATYDFAVRWTPWLEAHGVRVVTVSDLDRTPDNITNKHGGVFIPAFTAYASDKTGTYLELEENEQGELIEMAREEYIVHRAGDDSGQFRRQCTHRWKIRPMRRWLRSRGVKQAEQWLGITVDEVERAKDSDVKWITHRFPLLEKKMTRLDCLTWLEAHDLPTPGKSSCVFCPYHTRSVFAEMKRGNGPDWQTAVKVDEAIRGKRPGYVAYVHPDRIPLLDVTIAEDFGAEQLSFDLLDAECDSGYCFL